MSSFRYFSGLFTFKTAYIARRPKLFLSHKEATGKLYTVILDRTAEKAWKVCKLARVILKQQRLFLTEEGKEKEVCRLADEVSK